MKAFFVLKADNETFNLLTKLMYEASSYTTIELDMAKMPLHVSDTR